MLPNELMSILGGGILGPLMSGLGGRGAGGGNGDSGGGFGNVLPPELMKLLMLGGGGMAMNPFLAMMQQQSPQSRGTGYDPMGLTRR